MKAYISQNPVRQAKDSLFSMVALFQNQPPTIRSRCRPEIFKSPNEITYSSSRYLYSFLFLILILLINAFCFVMVIPLVMDQYRVRTSRQIQEKTSHYVFCPRMKKKVPGRFIYITRSLLLHRVSLKKN